MNTKCISYGLLASVLLLASTLPSLAVIPLPEMPVTRIYAASKQVIIGKITRIAPENRVLEVAVTETSKGDPAGDTIRIQIVQPEQLLKQLTPAQPVIVFVSRASAAATIHLADTWLIAQSIPNAQTPSWRTVQQADLARSFPGRTPALIRILADIKERKPTLLNAIQDSTFRGGITPIARLNLPKPTFLSAADINADKRIDLLIGSGGGVKLMLGSNEGFRDVTEFHGLKSAASQLPISAVGDINADNRPDALIGSTLWINDGTRFTPSAKIELPPAASILAVALADVTGDRFPELLALQRTGELTIFQNPAAPDKAWAPRPAVNLWPSSAEPPVAASFGQWGDDDRPCLLLVNNDGVVRYALTGESSDFHRLTGEKPEAFRKAFPKGLQNAIATPGDFNGDARPDFFILADTGALLLINRGFGAYFINPDAAASLRPNAEKPLPFTLGPSVCWTAADLHADRHDDLLILGEDGTLYQVQNTPANP